MSLEFYIMVGTALFLLLRGIVHTERLWHAPTWVGFIFIAYIVPQAIFLEKSAVGRQLDLWFAWLYIAASLLVFFFGFESGRKRVMDKRASDPAVYPNGALVGRAFIVLLLGAVSLIKVREMSVDIAIASQWGGVITFYYLIFQCIFMAFCIAMVRWLTNRRRIWLIIGGLALLCAIVAIAANAKRSLTAEIVFIAGMSLFFLRGVLPGRVVIIVAMLLGTVLVNQVQIIRNYVNDGRGTSYEAVMDGAIFEKFEYFDSQKAPELTQAAVDIYRTNAAMRFEGPALLWNKLIHQYVPAFLVGRGFKESLKFREASTKSDYYSRYEWFGATRTGFSDSYRGYGVFGVFVFGVIGWIMGWLYSAAVRKDTWALFLYPLLLNDSMFAFTDSTSRFFSGSLFVVLVAIFLFWGASAKRYKQFVPSAPESLFHRH